MRLQQRILQNIRSAIIPSLRRGSIEHAPVSSIAASLSQPVRLYAASSSSKRWVARQTNDHAARLAEIKGLRSRAGIKLEEINAEFKIFKSGQTVVDLVGLSVLGVLRINIIDTKQATNMCLDLRHVGICPGLLDTGMSDSCLGLVGARGLPYVS